MELNRLGRSSAASEIFAARLWNQLVPPCQRAGCPQNRRLWQRMRGRRQQIVVQGLRYCVETCLDGALRDALAEASRRTEHPAVTHRVPIGLLLVSRQQLTPGQLRAALEAQRAAGRGRIGEWLQGLGYATEEQVTTALARQWSCPVLRTDSLALLSRRIPPLPLTLMRWLAVAPVDFVEPTRTLHLAFSDGLDYTVSYAIERMLECRTEPCLVQPSRLQRHFKHVAESRTDGEVLFQTLHDISEIVRVVRSYALRVGALEIRLTGCGPHLWVRLLRPDRNPVDLIVRELSEVFCAPESPLSRPPAI
jgi:hypothetical protein